MMNYEYPFDDFQDEEEDMGCYYGAEFCEEYFTREMGLCTTECSLYFKMVQDQENIFNGCPHCGSQTKHKNGCSDQQIINAFKDLKEKGDKKQ